MYDVEIRGPVIEGNKTFQQITKDICKPLYSSPGYWWYITLAISFGALAIGGWALYITLHEGIGSWGLNNTVSWGSSIINFVWWIGIGHAGTAFSIFLLILLQKWRTSINRSSRRVQQMQPLDISTSFSSVRLSSAPPSRTSSASMLTSLMSLTITATRSPARLAST